MIYLISNFGKSRLSAGAGIGATELHLQGGTGDKFPSPATGQGFFVLVGSPTQQPEIRVCTHRVGDVLTIDALEKDWGINTSVINPVNAELLQAFVQRPELGTAAFSSATEFATAAQGAKADSALQSAPVSSVAGRTGAVTLSASDISGLGSAALTPSSAYDSAGTATGAVASHASASDPHGDRAFATSAIAALGLGNAGDSLWGDVALLLPLDGANGSTTFADVKGGTITASGGAAISTAQSRFGGASAYLGSGRHLSSPAMVLGTGDWTVEFWAYCPVASDSGYSASLAQFGTAGNGGDGFSVTRWPGSSSLRLRDSYAWLVDVPGFTTGAWHHVAVVKHGSLLYAFLDGAMSSGLTPEVDFSAAASLRLGYCVETLIQHPDVYIDDVRVTVGTARYTATFTPPVGAFPTSAHLIDGIVPSQSGNAGKFLTTDGYAASWGAGGSGITALTGDGTASGSGSAALTLATVNASVGSYGDSTHIPNFTVNAKGLVTAAGASAINIPSIPLASKGDILVYGSSNARLPVGVDGYALVADSTQALGVKWAAVSGGGGGGGITALTGDVAASGTGSVSATLATVNANVGTFGDANNIPQITVDGKGRIVGINSVAATGGGGATPAPSSTLLISKNFGGF